MIGREEKWGRVRKKLENNCFLSSPRISPHSRSGTAPDITTTLSRSMRVMSYDIVAIFGDRATCDLPIDSGAILVSCYATTRAFHRRCKTSGSLTIYR